TGQVKNSPESAGTEKAKIEAHWDSFSEDFIQMETPKDEFVKSFEARQKMDPKITAEEFLTVNGSIRR
ncbi:MAG TPA: hypothetical protein VGP68_08080, partial [Gemmataceae bacterium]|nr:hypothetical protein [Gemmataceae bacterium]